MTQTMTQTQAQPVTSILKAVSTERLGTCLAKNKSGKPAASPYCAHRRLLFISPPMIPRWGIARGGK